MDREALLEEKQKMYHPYFDLEPACSQSPLHVRSLSMLYESVLTRQHPLGLLGSYFASLREEIALEAGFPHEQVASPFSSRQSPQWQMLVKRLEAYPEDSRHEQAATLQVLQQLCFYTTIRSLVPHIPREMHDDALIGYYRTHASYLLALEQRESWQKANRDYEEYIQKAPLGSLGRVHASYHFCVQAYKILHDVEALRSRLVLHEQALEAAKSSLQSWEYTALLSRYYRVAGFLPLMHGDRAWMAVIMEQCETLARSLPRHSVAQELTADETLFSALQSRSKEAQENKDWDVAEERARQLLQIDPFDVSGYLEVGTLLFQRARYEEACTMYTQAVRYGPPGTEIGYFQLGYCYEQLQQPEKACEMYRAALEIDPQGISSAERLVAVGKQLGQKEQVALGRRYLEANHV